MTETGPTAPMLVAKELKNDWMKHAVACNPILSWKDCLGNLVEKSATVYYRGVKYPLNNVDIMMARDPFTNQFIEKVIPPSFHNSIVPKMGEIRSTIKTKVSNRRNTAGNGMESCFWSK